MPLDPNYVPFTGLWELHTDKDTTELLANGYVLFFRDTARTTGKPVYQLTGSPPNYNYIQYGFLVMTGPNAGAWQVNLNDQGAFSQIPYGYCLDSNGDLDLYFVQFYNNNGIFQFSREGVPNFFAVSQNTPQIPINYIPNGQFRLHTDIPKTATLEEGEIRQAVTQIAYGGWTFARPTSSTARDFVNFQRIGAFITNPSKSPRYAVRAKCENPSGDQFKDIRIRFDDVNKFSSATQEYTFSIVGQIMSGGNINIDLILIKNFGTGGDTTTETNLTTFSVTSVFTNLFFSFVFGANSGKTIGTLDDDYLELALRLPPNSIFDVEFTDAILTIGNVNNPTFDDTTTRQFIYRSLFEDIVPQPDGSDINLPLILTSTGLGYDDSSVGSIMAQTTSDISAGWIKADGSQYKTSSYFPDGVPCSRLQKKYLNIANSETIPRYGTGKNFVTVYPINGTFDGTLRIVNNSPGTVPDFSDGGIPTGFTFHNINSGSVNTGSLGIFYNGNSFYILGNSLGIANSSISAGTSGFTVSTLRNNALMKYLASVTIPSVSGLAGKYFSFSNTTTNYYVWYKVDGSGTDPAPGGTGIEIDILSTWNILAVAQITAAAICGLKQTGVVCIAASSVTPGSYFYINTALQDYYAWYSVNGAGTDPSIPGKIAIEVSLNSVYSPAAVSEQTTIFVNSYYFAVPDLRGMFLRGWDNGAGIDPDSLLRWSLKNDFISGDNVGTMQLDQIPNISITTDSFGQPGGFDTYVAGSATESSAGILPVGGSESRPINASVNWLVKY